jgi:SAM-dependent methyltransferase
VTASAGIRPEVAALLAEERELMDAWAPSYDVTQVSNGLVYQLERAAFARWIGERVRAAGRDPGRLSLLDAGCGNGQLAERLAGEGFARVIGLDLSPGMLVEARRRQIAGGEWLEGTIEDPPEHALGVDVVVAAYVLHHMFDPGAFAGMLERALRPGGWFFVLDFDPAGVGRPRRSGHLRRGAGSAVRTLLRRKNRRALENRHVFDPGFNSAHRFLAAHELVGLFPADRYETERVPRSAFLGSLSPVLVDDSRLDRRLAQWAIAADRRLRPSSGAFQWLMGRRKA